jgi:hypothetical protein
MDGRPLEDVLDRAHGLREVAHRSAALGGRLVHGCQSGTEINMAGGCVAPYGADIERFRSELGRFRETWIEAVRACGK